MRSFSRVLSLAVLLAFGFSAFALTLEGTFTGATYYVSKTGSNGDAKSWATAKTNIQDAVNLCVDGDTVIVDDGEYSETTNYTVSGQGDVPTVVIIRKRIHLVSRNGKEKTHIVGKWSDDGKGAGVGAHRGIYVTAANTLIENFTFAIARRQAIRRVSTTTSPTAVALPRVRRLSLSGARSTTAARARAARWAITCVRSTASSRAAGRTAPFRRTIARGMPTTRFSSPAGTVRQATAFFQTSRTNSRSTARS